MPLGLETAGGVDRHRAVEGGKTLSCGPPALPRTEEAKVLQMDYLRDGEAVVYFGKLDILGGKTRHLVCLLRGEDRRLVASEIALGMQAIAAPLSHTG